MERMRRWAGRFSASPRYRSILVFAAYMLLDGIRIGGPEARPVIGRFAAIAIGVAASTSLGLLFWAAAEPVYHAHQPPRSFGLDAAERRCARLFARAATYLHWSLTVHAISALLHDRVRDRFAEFGAAAHRLGDVIFGASGEAEPGGLGHGPRWHRGLLCRPCSPRADWRVASWPSPVKWRGSAPSPPMPRRSSLWRSRSSSSC